MRSQGDEGLTFSVSDEFVDEFTALHIALNA